MKLLNTRKGSPSCYRHLISEKSSNWINDKTHACRTGEKSKNSMDYKCIDDPTSKTVIVTSC